MLAGAITDNGVLVFDRDNTVTQGGVIAGAGVVIVDVQGLGGILTLPVANTFTGGSTIYNSTVAIGSGAALGTGKIILNGGTVVAYTDLTIANTVFADYPGTAGGTLAATSGITLTATGPITLGDGALAGPGTIATTGTVTIGTPGGLYAELDGSVTWINGGTVINAGTINADWPSGTGFDSIINNALFKITANGTAIQPLNAGTGLFTNTGTLAKTAGNGTSIFNFPIANTGNILAQTGTLSFTGGVINSTTMEANADGNLTIGGPVHNIGAVITAVGTGAVVTLAGTVFGGTLTASAGGVINTGGSNGVLDGVGLHPITINAPILVGANTALMLLGAIVNDSTINVTAGGTVAALLIGSQASPITTLQGTGVVNLNSGNFSVLYSNNDYELINQTNTIQGAGQLGDGELSFVNAALVNANKPGALVLDTSAGAFATNTGTLEATSTGGLVIRSAVDNAGGTVQAPTAGSHVDLAGGTIRGGTLITANGGVIQTTTSNPGGLDGSAYGALANTGLVRVNNLSTLTLAGTIVNTGTIFEDATTTSGITDIELVSHVVTLTGAGRLLLSNISSNLVSGDTVPNADYLINQGNMISGAGNFGGGSIQYVNASGSIIATGTTALTIDPNGLGIGVNDASMLALGTGGMVLSQGIFTNNGTMLASDHSAITFQQAAINTNLAEGDLVSGTWQAVAAGHGATLSMTGGPIVDAAATIVLQGVGSVIQAGAGTGGTPYTPVEQTLTMVASSGLLDVVSGRGWAGTQSLTVAGILEFAGGTFHASGLAVATGGLVEAFGTIATSVANSALVESFAAGTLTITGNVSGAGTLLSETGTTLTLNGTSDTVGFVEDDGAIVLGGGVFHVGSATIAAAAHFTAAGTVTEVGPIANAGLIEALAGEVLALNGTVTGSGTLQSDTGANLGLTEPGSSAGAVVDNGEVGVSGGLTVSGNLTGTGTLNVSPATTVTLDGAANTIGIVQDNGTIVLTTNGTFHANTNTIGATGQLTASATITETGAIANAGGIEATANQMLSLNGAVTGAGTLQSDSGANIGLQAAGNTAGALVDNGLIGIAQALTVSGAVSGTGTLNISPGATLTLNGTSAVIGTMTDNGLLSLGGGTFHATTITVAGGAQLAAVTTVVETGAIMNTGRVEADAGAVLSVNGDVTGGGTLQADSTGDIALNQPANSAATVLDNGIVGLGQSDSLDITGSVDPASTGSFSINTTSLLEVAAATGAGAKMSFVVGTTGDELAIDAVSKFGSNVGSASYTGPLLENFAATDTIDLKKLLFAGATLDSYSAVTGLLQLHSGATLATLAFQNSSLHNAGAGLAGFHLGTDGNNGTFVTHS